MGKRKYMLDPFGAFQKKLEDFFQAKTARLEGQQQASKAYMEAVYAYHKLGMSLREISAAIGVPPATVNLWIQKMKKEHGEAYAKT